MIDVCISVDVESRKGWDGERVVHLDVERDVRGGCVALDGLAARFGARLTFFYPVTELAHSGTGVAELAAKLAARHELGVHAHLPFAAWDEPRIAGALTLEADALERATGVRPVSVRAGGYATGDQRAWIAACGRAGFRVDSSVWPGASTDTSWEAAHAAGTYAALWGGGGIAYDYRGAPIAGLYPVAADSLCRPGDGPLLEAPIAAVAYEERDARPFLLDAHGMSAETLVASLEHLDRLVGGRGVAVVLAHSYGIARNGRLTAVGRRLEAVLAWAHDRGARVAALDELAAEAEGWRGTVYALEQPQRWPEIDRSDLAGLVGRCPRCGEQLGDLACSACGFAGERIAPALVDVRIDRTPAAYAPTARGRGGRYLRAGLSISGGALAATFGTALFPVARARHALRRLRQSPRRD